VAEEQAKPRDKKSVRGEEIGVPLKVFVGEAETPNLYPRYIIELDKERIYIKTTEVLTVGAHLKFAFDDPMLERAIVLTGEVVRINQGSTRPGGLEAGMGIVLDPVRIEDRADLSKFFEKQADEDRTGEYLQFLSWVRKVSKPMVAEEREKVRRDLLRALYGDERQPLVSQKKKREDIEILSNIPLFKELDTMEISEVAEILLKEKVEAGKVIFNEGDAGDKFYIIMKGEVDIFKKLGENREEVLAVLKAGDYFGEMSLLDQAPRSAGARARGDTVVLTIFKPDFDILLKASDSITAKIYRFFVATFSRRLREADEKIKRIAQVLSSGSI
jgi:CRP/FNR family transcriptional regulator, cyclic AMP receptor protein